MRLRLHSPDPNSEPNPSGSAHRGGQARTSTSGSAEIRSAKLAAATPAPHTAPHTAPNGDSRLNLLLTYGGWRENAFADQIPLILNRIGIRCFRAESGDEASDVIRREHVHIAVIDWSIPMHPTRAQVGGRAAPAITAGPRVLQLLRRLDQPPPTIVVRPRQSDAAEDTRTLADALRDGAFTVLDDPVPIETMLQALERVVRRHYRDHWPAA